MMLDMDIFERLVQIHGSKLEAARICGVTKQVLNHWRVNSRIPAKYYHVIVETSGGMISYMDLIPAKKEAS